jgi:NAD(P)-dependent dehydrogenase (short-subunit alcohol dehydrogenase family)
MTSAPGTREDAQTRAPDHGDDGMVAHRVALVTGGTRGIGAAVSRALAQEGASVAAGYWHNQEAAEKFAASMRADYPRQKFTTHEGNIGVADDCRRVVNEVIEQHGRLDILVNNAGITIDKVAAKMSDEDWHRVLDVNLSGAFFISQAALDHMMERGTGRIVNVSSVIGEMGNIGQVNYAASKSGLFGLTKSLAREAIFHLGKAGRPPGEGAGVTVNAVTPGFIETDMVAGMPEKALDRVRAQIPMGRLGQPEEVARVVAFLAADDSAYITGQTWAVNGGLDM